MNKSADRVTTNETAQERDLPAGVVARWTQKRPVKYWQSAMYTITPPEAIQSIDKSNMYVRAFVIGNGRVDAAYLKDGLIKLTLKAHGDVQHVVMELCRLPKEA